MSMMTRERLAELQHLRELGTVHGELLDTLDAALKCVEAVKESLNILGHGNCQANLCDGCKVEEFETRAILEEALKPFLPQTTKGGGE